MITPENRGKLEGAGMPTLANLRKSEWSPEFEEFMRNRLIVGYHRYGPFEVQNVSTARNMAAILKRAEEYIDTGNDELLVDIANLSMKEFATGDHPKKHFESVDDGEHV